LGLVTALAAGLLGVLAALADVGDRAAIGTGVARITRVGFKIGGRGWSGVLLPDEQGMVAMVAARWVLKSSSMRR
jgi:hypothetical protein